MIDYIIIHYSKKYGFVGPGSGTKHDIGCVQWRDQNSGDLVVESLFK